MPADPPAQLAEPDRPARALLILCITEITSWGVLYYAFPVMLADVSAQTGWSTGHALAAYSTGLLTSAVAGAPIGRLLDRHGPGVVMTAGSLVGVAALLAVSAVHSLPGLFGAWTVVGLAQAALLYPPAFAALTRWYQPRQLRSITALSLVAGLSSTVFAPTTAALVAAFGWRRTLVTLAVVLGVVTIPLHASLLRTPWNRAHRDRRTRRAPGAGVSGTVRSRPFGLLTAALALAAFGLYGVTMNLVPLLTGHGLGTGLAATMFGLVGVGQVLGRLGYPTLTRRTSPPVRTAAVLFVGALAVAALGLLSPHPVALVAVLAIWAGAARGSHTLLQATAVSDRWGTERYATLNGIAMAPTTAAVAVAPAGTALLADVLGYPRTCFVLAAITVIAAGAALGTQVSAGGGRQGDS